MSSPLAGVDPRWLLYGAAVVAVGYVAWKLSRVASQGAAVAAEAVQTAVASINPADERNLVNRGVSAAGAAVTGDQHWTLGGQLAEWFSPSVRAANESLRTTSTQTSDARAIFRRSELERERATAPVWNYADDPAATFTLGAAP